MVVNLRLLYKILIGVGSVFVIFIAYYLIVDIYVNQTKDSYHGNNPPRAYIDGPQQVYYNQMVTYNANDSYDDDGDELTYTWEFYDGTNMTGKVVEYTFTEYYGNVENDTHRITLTVSDGENEDFHDLFVTVILHPDSKAPSVDLRCDSTSIPGLPKLYIVEVIFVSQGDADISHISYSLLSGTNGATLAGGMNSTVGSIDKAPIDSPVRYVNNYDADMEMNEYFSIDSEALSAKEGDEFFLYHIPTGIKIGYCQLIG